MQVNPYEKSPDEMRAWRRRARMVGRLVGLALCLGGSYIAVMEAFDDHYKCFGPLGCMDTSKPEDIWLGLVMVAAGVGLLWVNRSSRPLDDAET